MKGLLKILGIYAVFLLQSLIFENINIFSITPDILLAAVIFTAISGNVPFAALAGGFSGLLTDAVCGRFFGVYTLLYMYLACTVAYLTDKSTANSPLLCAWAGFVSVSAYKIMCSVVLLLFGIYKPFSGLGADIFVNGLLTALFIFIMVLILNKSEKSKKSISSKEVEAS